MSGNRARAVAAVAVAGLTATGCGFHGIYSLPLPGAAGGSNTYSVNVELRDVLDLVPYSAVKVNEATVGHVKKIGLRGQVAVVRCVLPKSVHLPANAIARVEQTSLLGEKFVEIEQPPVGTAAASTTLRNGSTIPLSRTNTDATVEEVLGALALLLNGGGLNQVRTIATEVNTALRGREGDARELLTRLTDFAAGLNAQKTQIIQALDGINRLSATLRAQESVITTAVVHLPPALAILADDRKQLTTMLTALRHLGGVATHVVNASRDDLLANLRHLRPTLTKLAEAGINIPKSLELFFTFPTTDGVEKAYFGDYGNLFATLDLSSKSLAANFDLPPLPIPGGATAHAPAARQRAAPKLPAAPRTPIGHLLLGVLR